MVTTAYNFKQWFKRHYPDITINPVYGMEAYTFDKPMSPQDMFEYNVQQLQNGLYIVFVGRTPIQVMELMRDIAKNGIQYIRPKRAIPTTFASFENWLRINNVKPLYRTHIARQTASEALHTASDESTWNQKRDWYMYEFTANTIENFGGPHIETENGTTVILVKASTNTYVSKKQLFLQKFALMQPLFEQLVAACAKEEWDKANELCSQYASIQFDTNVSVIDTAAVKEAYERNELNLFVRIRTNFSEVNDGF